MIDDQGGAWPLCSLNSCSNLGWDLHPHGDFFVCGGTPSCAGEVAQTTASDTCTAEGARLCTAQEILDDEPTGTGCQYDNELVWTQSSCSCDPMCLNTFHSFHSPETPNCCNDDRASAHRYYVMYSGHMADTTGLPLAADLGLGYIPSNALAYADGRIYGFCMSTAGQEGTYDRYRSAGHYGRCCADEGRCYTHSPTSYPTPQPTPEPTFEPTHLPTSKPTPKPSQEPTSQPTHIPTPDPTPFPTEKPTSQPTHLPTPGPTKVWKKEDLQI